jgi:GNAT superfamily N-acetyltransferase
MEIRETTEDDWAAVRDVRLRALAEAPLAFGSTFGRERDRTEEEWRRWAGRGRTGEGVLFVADEGGRFVGLAGGYPEAEADEDEAQAQAIHLVSMWVDPAHRGEGLGRCLVEAVVGWARDRGARVVNLSVTDANDPAIALYTACGFRPTGDTQPLPSNPAYGERKYRLDLTRST